MNYLQTLSQRIDIALHGYTTPNEVIDKIIKNEECQYRPQIYTSNRKLSTLLGNPPYNGKAES